MAALDAYFARIQKKCLPGIWSKGVTLSRSEAVIQDSASESELALRVLVKDRPVSPKVTLWPEDDDWYCDCDDRNEVCAHVAACVIAIKGGLLKKSGEAASGTGPSLIYRFSRSKGALRLDRVIEHAGQELPVEGTLVALVGGISSGRIALPAVAATREDFAVDAILSAAYGHELDRAILSKLLRQLSEIRGRVFLEGSPVQASGRPTGLRAEVTEVPGGFRLRSEMDPSIREVFSNGAALCGENVLRTLALPSLTPAENTALSAPGGRVFRTQEEIARLVSELLPSIEKKLPLEVRTEKLPSPLIGIPKIALRLEQPSEDELVAVAQIIYPEKAGPGEVLILDPAAETALTRKLQSELHLAPGQPARFRGKDAIDFTLKLESRSSDPTIVLGSAHTRFLGTTQTLTPHFELTDAGFKLSFTTQSAGDVREADSSRVLDAWNDGAEHVPLLGGGWAKLPGDWLSRFGRRIQALTAAREAGVGEASPSYFAPQLAELAEELGTAVPDGLKRLRARLEDTGSIPESPLPADLRAELRDYQRTGVRWLAFLRDQGMGALLADDMGLGKTLQALCAIQGKALVVCPTSVLSAWSGQIARFRPGLGVNVYHGSKRELTSEADITLTTYAVLRLDQEALCAREWDTIVLDEAQTIKNPSSQVAQTAHRLRGRFRIALSGTPVENRLEDLWSQFQFVNPGLLGSRTAFRDEFAQGLSRGDPRATQRLRARIKPFLLRRLKSEVARELPPRTEIVLHCELSETERELYDSLLASSRKEVLAQLDQGASPFAALELLLRLRQACCSPALVPGGAAQSENFRKTEIFGGSAQLSQQLFPKTGSASSKVRLLADSLTESAALGHRALVFSQWTSMLDLIEPALHEAGLAFLRLDGSTRDRESVVNAFQAPQGPPVLLISLKAGGTGLTLTAADHIYIVDPWWNPAVEDQAADRAHRIGQENPVLIQRLVAHDTVEDRILALQKRKQELAGAVLEGTAGGAALTAEDIRELLS